MILSSPGSAFAHWCSFVCIPCTRDSASSWPGHGAPIFISDLHDPRFGCEHAGPLRHVAGFPDLGLLRVLRPIPPASAGDGPSHLPPWLGGREGPAGWFPRSLSNRSTGSAPSYAPAASPRLRRRPSPWPPGRRHNPTQEFPAPVGASTRCCAALIHQVRAAGSLEERFAAGFSRTPFRLACRTRTIWQYWPVPSLSGLLSTLTPVPGFRLPSASVRPLRRAHGGVLSSPRGW